MKAIEFDALYGDQTKHVEIAWPSGANGAVYISIDNYHEGQMVYQMGEWRAYLNGNTILTGDDVSVIIGMLEEKQKAEG